MLAARFRCFVDVKKFFFFYKSLNCLHFVSVSCYPLSANEVNLAILMAHNLSSLCDGVNHNDQGSINLLCFTMTYCNL